MSDQIVRVGVGVIIFNRTGQILMGQRRNAHGAGSWAIIGGHLEHGETFDSCARREAWEETGLELANVETAGVANHVFDNGKHYVSVYLVARMADFDAVPAIDSREFAQWRFVDDWPAEPLFVPYRDDVRPDWLASYRIRHLPPCPISA